MKKTRFYPLDCPFSVLRRETYLSIEKDHRIAAVEWNIDRTDTGRLPVTSRYVPVDLGTNLPAFFHCARCHGV